MKLKKHNTDFMMNLPFMNYRILSYVVVGLFAIFPFLFNLPFRIHLDLPYEGAYRLYLGQIPFKDYTMPLGYGFFIIPAGFFFLFGPFLKSLLLAQALITIIGCFSFISILRTLKMEEVHIFIAVLVFCLSYTFIYFWPWYNNTAFTFELLGISLILKSFYTENRIRSIILLALGVFAVFMTFLTKQDYGGLAFVFGLVLVLYIGIIRKRYFLPVAYLLLYVFFAFLFIYPLLKYDFFYWFNLGQPPHDSRLKLIDLVNEVFLNSEWEKFYLLAMVVLIFNNVANIKAFIFNQKQMLLLLICAGFILEALITKTTSKQSTGNTTYFHGFAIAFILAQVKFKFDTSKLLNMIPILLFILVWWSGMYWKYAGRIFKFSEKEQISTKNKSQPLAPEWIISEFKSLEKVKLPGSTVEGIRRLKQLGVMEGKPDAKVLNLTELTMLAYELGYIPMKGLPLWYHLHIGIFQPQVDEICRKIKAKEYDLVLFEEIPSLENFFPEQVRDSLKQNYSLKDNFMAPRKEGDSFIEVYMP